MNADEFDRELEDALCARAAVVAPPEFTTHVIRRVAGERSQRLQTPRWLSALTLFCDPVAAGIMLVVVGATLVFDLGGLLFWWGNGLAAPTPLFVAASALFVSGMYLSNRLSED
jgi:anti-sigma factor RsiW